MPKTKKTLKKKVKTEQELASPMELLRQSMSSLWVQGSFPVMGIESSKISSIKIPGKKFKTKKLIMLDPVIEGLEGRTNVCYLVTRVE